MGSVTMFLPVFASVLLSSALAQDVCCPPGWWRAGEACYITSQDKMTWYKAQEFCWGVGGYLAEIKSVEQEAALDGLLSYSAEYWIGLSDLSVEGHFVWAESHQDLETTEYTHWATNQPDDGGGHEDCVVKVVKAEGKLLGEGWNDYVCSRDNHNDHGDHPIHALCMMIYG